MVKIMSLLIKAGSGHGFMFGVRALRYRFLKHFVSGIVLFSVKGGFERYPVYKNCFTHFRVTCEHVQAILKNFLCPRIQFLWSALVPGMHFVHNTLSKEVIMVMWQSVQKLVEPETASQVKIYSMTVYMDIRVENHCIIDESKVDNAASCMIR